MIVLVRGSVGQGKRNFERTSAAGRVVGLSAGPVLSRLYSKAVKPALLALALPLVGCGHIDVITHLSAGDDEEQAVLGTGKPVSETRKAQAATAAEFSGALAVTIRSGAPSLRIEAQKALLHYIKTKFENGRLKVWTEGTMNADGAMRVWFTTPRVSEVKASGATTVDVAALSGGSARVKLSGASKAKAAGKVGKLEVEVSGASEADLKALASDAARVKASGASKVWVRTSGALDAQASGASEIRYFGKPTRVRDEASGASSVSAG